MSYQIVHRHPYQYELPFPQHVKGQMIERKHSMLYVLEDRGGRLFTTELSPFPGISGDDLTTLTQEFEQCVRDHHLNSSNPHLAFCFFELDLKSQWPSARSLDLSRLASNHLMPYRKPQWDHLKPGDTLKIKIDRDLEAVLNFLTTHREQLAPHSLRLDANQRLDLAQAERLYGECQNLGLTVDYFEEPFSRLTDYQHCQLPFALDEHIASFSKLKGHQHLKALVFKPTQYFQTSLWEQRATPLIISSTFDSLFTHATLQAMAGQWSLQVHGLGVCGEQFGLGRDRVHALFPTLDRHYLDLLRSS